MIHPPSVYTTHELTDYTAMLRELPSSPALVPRDLLAGIEQWYADVIAEMESRRREPAAGVHAANSS